MHPKGVQLGQVLTAIAQWESDYRDYVNATGEEFEEADKVMALEIYARRSCKNISLIRSTPKARKISEESMIWLAGTWRTKEDGANQTNKR